MKAINNPTEASPGQVASGLSETDSNPFKEQVNAALMTLKGKVRSAQKLRDDVAAEYAIKQKEMNNLPEVQMVLARYMTEKQSDEDNLKEENNLLRPPIH